MVLKQWIDELFANTAKEDAPIRQTETVVPAQADPAIHRVPEPEVGWLLGIALAMVIIGRRWRARHEA